MFETATKSEELLVGIKTLKALMSLMYESILEEIPEMDDERRDWKLENFCRRQDLFQALLDSMFDKTVTLCELGEGVPFERMRRITGYLVGSTEKFNDAKRHEEKDRVKHGIGGKG